MTFSILSFYFSWGDGKKRKDSNIVKSLQIANYIQRTRVFKKIILILILLYQIMIQPARKIYINHLTHYIKGPKEFFQAPCITFRETKDRKIKEK